jgi:hypothetical protein
MLSYNSVTGAMSDGADGLSHDLFTKPVKLAGFVKNKICLIE